MLKKDANFYDCEVGVSGLKLQMVSHANRQTRPGRNNSYSLYQKKLSYMEKRKINDNHGCNLRLHGYSRFEPLFGSKL